MAAQRYRLVDVTPKDCFGFARDINSVGQVLAAVRGKDEVLAGVVWGGELVVRLVPVGGEDLDVRAVNDDGIVVGSAQVAGVDYACAWVDGRMEFLETPEGAGSCAHDINKHGIVIGYHPRKKNPALRASALWTRGQGPENWRCTEFFPDFLPFEYLGSEFAMAVSDRGVVVGQVSRFGFLKKRDEFTKIEGRTADGVMPLGVNNNDVVVGFVIEPDEQYAFRFLSAIESLGTIGGSNSQASGINDAGHIVGASSFESGEEDLHGFVWIEAKMFDLNELVQNLGNYVITSADAINNAGQIAATAILDRVDRAVLLTPI